MVSLFKPRRTVRSFVRREGRITKAQQQALIELWPRYGVEDDNEPLDFVDLFQRHVPVILEIGFGNGDALCSMAEAHPEVDYLGIEVHRPGVGSLLRKLSAGGLTNVRVMLADAKEVLATRIPDASLSGLHLFFPDPWPKKRHHKRRLVQADFIELVCRKLQPGGYVHMATDWKDYAEQMLALLSQSESFENTAGVGRYAERPAYRPLTKFERRGRDRGHHVWDLIYRRIF